jgi:deoxyribonuclease V
MQLKQPVQHQWNLPLQKAQALQKELSEKIILRSTFALSEIRTVAGIDTHYDEIWAVAAVVNMDLMNLNTIDFAAAKEMVDYPYIPGLFSFREGPAILSALKKLQTLPDLLIFDGQGIAHPRRFGLACHIGLLVDIPSIGCAKTKLIGQYSEPHSAKGSFTYLDDLGETIGAAVRTRNCVKPVYVSIGHRINLEDSIKIILQCCDKYRLPEPIRRADKLARLNAP